MAFDLVQAVGKVRGHFKTKENRAAKLISMWPALKRKMEQMVIRGRGRTDQARLAYAVLMMMETGIRVGNEDSAEGFICENKYHPNYGKEVQTFGLTTLQHKHIVYERHKNRIILEFVGKKSVDQRLSTTNPILFRFCPLQKPHETSDQPWLNIAYEDLRKFVKRYVGRQFKPKDIRTAKVNILFVDRFANRHAPLFASATTKSSRKKILSQCVEEVAEEIGHTKGVCRSAYLSKPLLANILMTEQGTIYLSNLKWQGDL